MARRAYAIDEVACIGAAGLASIGVYNLCASRLELGRLLYCVDYRTEYSLLLIPQLYTVIPVIGDLAYGFLGYILVIRLNEEFKNTFQAHLDQTNPVYAASFKAVKKDNHVKNSKSRLGLTPTLLHRRAEANSRYINVYRRP